MLRQFHFRVHKMSLTLMSSCRKHPCKCIVAARHKTGADLWESWYLPAFLRKTCSVRYALIPSLNEFIEQVRANLTSDRGHYNDYSYTYIDRHRSSRRTIKMLLPHFALEIICFWKWFNFFSFCIFMLPFYCTMIDIEYPRF